MKPQRVFNWRELVTFIEKNRVIPVIGPELLVLNIGGRQVVLHRYLAERLADILEIPISELPKDFELNDVASLFVHRYPTLRSRIYSSLDDILNEAPLPVPEPLRKLASISGFKFFVSVTFDDFLSRALNEVIFAGEQRTQNRVFSLARELEDLPCEANQLRAPLVYQLFGKFSPFVEYAVTEEDTLEYLHVLQSGSRQPKLLFDELQKNYLLILGCCFPDWLMRFFLRTVKRTRLRADSHHTWEAIVDRLTSQDAKLILFLQESRVDVFDSGCVGDFIEELARRWQERRPPHAVQEATASGRTVGAPPSSPVVGFQPRTKSEFIFLSYTHEDLEQVKVIKECFEAAGLDVWFDKRQLAGGDHFELLIHDNIKNCALFFPVISGRATSRLEGFFRREWKAAIQRSQDIDERFPFIQPICLDNTLENTPGVPDEFRNKHWQRFRDGRPTAEFIDRTRQLIRQLRALNAGRK